MRILLADDHALVRESITLYLSRADPTIETVEASDFEEAKEIALDGSPLDIIILDLKMPGMHGIAGIHEMRVLRPETPVVILSGSNEADDVIGARKLGASGFIHKSWSGERMLEGIHSVARGQASFPDIGDTIVASAPLPGANGEAAAESQTYFTDTFTIRERDVLNLLVKGLPNKLIARELGVAEVAVKVHLQNIFRKLGVNNRTQAVTTAAALGWSR